jgi:hypothetical protein
VLQERLQATSTYMRAFNAGGTQIASADSGGEERNARIILLVSANHIYYFRVSGVGPYRIVAAFTSMYDSTPLEFGSPVAGNISGGREYWYSVTPTTNGNIAVETTGSADTYMFVYNAEWEELAHDDRGGQGRNARIIIFASANQTYYFRVKGVRSYVTGPYHVVANFFANPGDGRGSGMSSSIPLEFGFPVPGNILGRTGIECWYSVTPTSNGNITVETTGSTDTYMYAYNAGGVELAHNDDGGQGSNARITIPVSANQTYYFKVRGFGSGTTGSYSVVANFSAN